jgi:hypothetical protein
MTVVIKNNRNHLVNLGKQNGKMLVFLPDESKEISEETSNAFESELCKYVEGDILTVVTKKKEARVVDSLEQKVPTTKKFAKKKVAKVAKE